MKQEILKQQINDLKKRNNFLENKLKEVISAYNSLKKQICSDLEKAIQSMQTDDQYLSSERKNSSG